MDRLSSVRQAGKVNRAAIDAGFDFVKPGKTTVLELDQYIGNFIRENNGIPAFLNYNSFPSNTCISINNEVAHTIATEKIIQIGDLLTIDCGTIIEGWYTDSAETRCIAFNDHPALLRAGKDILNSAISVLKDGVTLLEIAQACDKTAATHKVNIIDNLCGHFIGKNLHEPPSIFHTERSLPSELRNFKIYAGQLICIEPIITFGSPELENTDNLWNLRTKDGSFSVHFESSLLVTLTGYEVIC